MESIEWQNTWLGIWPRKILTTNHFRLTSEHDIVQMIDKVNSSMRNNWDGFKKHVETKRDYYEKYLVGNTH